MMREVWEQVISRGLGACDNERVGSKRQGGG